MDPTPAQDVLLSTHCGQARFLWNLCLEQWRLWQPGKRAPGYAELNRQLTELRAAEPWLASGSVTAQQQVLRDLDQAKRNFFGGTHRRPTWRKKDRDEGFRTVAVLPEHVRRLNRRWSAVFVPKVGWVRFRCTRVVPDSVKSYRVTWDASGRWHIAFAHIPAAIAGPGTGEVVGLDRGVAVSVMSSEGEAFHAPSLRPKQAERLLRLRRRLAVAQRGSNRRGRLKRAIARLRARETDQRKDWVEQTTTDLARRYDVVKVEDLDVRAMTRSAKGTKERPGRRVRQKAGLNRAILAQGWGLFLARLEHKARGRVRRVDPKQTSQRCSACGHVATENRESQAAFRCVACGFACNADLNAARNIAVGQTVTARGALGKSSRAVNREPQCLAFVA
ncbi:MAG: transposase [Candidatus Rokubacteria bacterium GWC2_70_24]|nr:MAG: transposase [Candidatus Rokubacteria bacterium GWA2_70_23]OGK86729.1 MAG: transposase [Candidatus Rokubacteria bacterium GWC2_70_24]